MRALRGTGSFAQRGDVLGCNCRCLHDGSWPLRHRSEERICARKDDDDLEQRHPNNSAIQLRRATWQRTANWLCDTLAEMLSKSTTSSRRETTLPDASELWKRDNSPRQLASVLQTASFSGISGRQKKRPRSRRCERSDVAVTQNSNSYERAPNEQEPRAPSTVSAHRLKK